MRFTTASFFCGQGAPRSGRRRCCAAHVHQQQAATRVSAHQRHSRWARWILPEGQGDCCMHGKLIHAEIATPFSCPATPFGQPKCWLWPGHISCVGNGAIRATARARRPAHVPLLQLQATLWLASGTAMRQWLVTTPPLANCCHPRKLPYVNTSSP